MRHCLWTSKHLVDKSGEQDVLWTFGIVKTMTLSLVVFGNEYLPHFYSSHSPSSSGQHTLFSPLIENKGYSYSCWL